MSAKIAKLFLNKIPLILLLFFVASFSIRTDFSFDQDLGRHIKLGEIILNTREVPKINLFSNTFPNFPFINHHFLFEVLVYLGQQFIGVSGLLIAKSFILLLVISLILSISKSPYFLTLPLGFIFLHTLRERVELRPEIFSFLFTALTFFALNKLEQGKNKWMYLLPVIQLLWVNTHIYFPVGLILQVIFLAHFYFKKNPYKRQLLVTFIFSVFISMINPNGINGFLYPLLIFGNYGYSIAENQNLFFLESIGFSDPNFFFVKLSAVIIVLSIILAAVYQKLTLRNFLLSSFGLALALLHIRSFPYLVLISLPAVLENLNFFKPKHSVALFIYLIFSFGILVESYFYITGDYYKYSNKSTQFEFRAEEQAKGAMDFVLENNLPQPIFNNFDIGSYITYRGFPNYKVFVDGRPEGYPKEFFQTIYIPVQENLQNFKKLDMETGFKTIIFSHTDQTPWAKNFLANIVKDTDWQIVYLDDFMIILVKSDVLENQKLKAIKLDNLTPKMYQFNNHLQPLRMGLFLLNNQKLVPAELFIKESLEFFPESPIGNLIMASLLQQRNNILELSKAREYFQKSKNPIWW